MPPEKLEQGKKSPEKKPKACPENPRVEQSSLSEDVVKDLKESAYQETGVSIPLQNVSKFEKDKNYEEILERSVMDTAKTNPYATFAYFDKFKNKPYAKDVLTLIAEKNPQAFFACFDAYKSEPYAKELVLIATSVNTFAAF